MAVVLITGCRSGIGLQTALAFARRGDRVYATSRDVVRVDQLRQSVNRECLPVEIQALDVTDGDAVRRMVGDVVAREGRIDVLVNNAGIGGGRSGSSFSMLHLEEGTIGFRQYLHTGRGGSTKPTKASRGI